MQEVVLDVQGMTCASCVHRITGVLEAQELVVGASVNLATRTAVVRTTGADPARLVEAVEQAGYAAAIHREARDDGAETRAYARRFVVSGFLTFYVLLLSFLVGTGSTGSRVAIWALATPVQFYGGWPFLRGAVWNFRRNVYTMDSLVSAGSLAAYGYSLWAVAAGHHELYFDTSAMIVTLILAGRTMESFTRAKAGDAARLLLERGAGNANVVHADRVESVPVDQLRGGDVVVVMPGEKIPGDGIVREGRSAVDLSLLTGESTPVDVGPGEEVFAASVNSYGRLVVDVTRVGPDTKLAEIVRLLERTQASKAPIQRLADRVASVFVPWMFAVAALTLLGWLFLASQGLGVALLHATAVLLIACPCALGLATPAAVMAGSGRAAELGILFRGGEVFDAARRIDTVLLDKTGTLTEGAMTLRETRAVSGEDPRHVLALAAAVEGGSEHPIARAVVARAAELGVAVPPASGYVSVPGHGASAEVEGVRVRVGRPDDLPVELAHVRAEFAGEAYTTFAVWADGRAIGLLGASDRLKDEAPQAVRWLLEYGFQVAVVTGDRQAAAEAVAREVGIDRVVAEVLPEGKVEEIRRLQAAGHRVAFIGDGVNDGPALVQADVGVALGTGTDVALEAADVKILGGDLERVADALFLSRWTYGVIAQNLTWAFAYNLVMVPLAAIGRLTPLMAAAAMAASSVSVVANALRLRRYRVGRTAIGSDDGSDPLAALVGISPGEIKRSDWTPAWW